MKKIISILLILLVSLSMFAVLAEEEKKDGNVIDSIGGFFSDTWDDATKFAGQAVEIVGEKAGDAWDGVSGAAGDAWNYVSGAADETWNGISQFATTQWDNLSEGASKTWESVSKTAGDAWYGAGEMIEGIWNNVTGAFEPSEEEMVTETEEGLGTQVTVVSPDDQVFFIGELVNTGKDNGFSGSKQISEKDPHYGWKLGSFYIKGFTRVVPDEKGYPVFLKTVGDKIALHYELYQDIDHLSGGGKKCIAEDKNGYDQYFGIPKTNFGRGALIVKHTNYQNYENTPTIYTDFLAARSTDDADTTVELFEEGDYEVALDYEINTPQLLNIASYTNYRVYFKFVVRNGNCMAFPFDIATGAELTDASYTENGFYLDLAKSRYLDVNVKKETLMQGVNGLVEDTRFNRPAKDGDQYTDKGIYTITVSNRYTGSVTIKKIFVGTKEDLQQYRDSGIAIPD